MADVLADRNLEALDTIHLAPSFSGNLKPKKTLMVQYIVKPIKAMNAV